MVRNKFNKLHCDTVYSTSIISRYFYFVKIMVVRNKINNKLKKKVNDFMVFFNYMLKVKK